MAAVEPPPSASPSPSVQAAVQPPPEKRRKITRACDNCKSKKKRCTGTQPCPSCEKASKPCTYLASYTRGRFNTPPSSRGLDALVLAAESHNHLSDRRRRDSSSCPEYPVSRRNADLLPSARPVLPPLHHVDSRHSWLRRAMRKLRQARPPSDGALPRSGTSSEATVFTFGDKPPIVTSGFEAPLPPPTFRAEYLVGRFFEFAMPTYRFLHRPSLMAWVWELTDDKAVMAPAKRAVLYMIFAYAMLYETSRIKEQETESRRKSETYFREAQILLAHETGPATLESVQARFIQCHYLLSTGRSNQAWYTFGTTVQLALALGLHRKRQVEHVVARETQRRLFWAIYTLDRYLAIVFGRPMMLQDDDISQQLPLAINDEDLTEAHPSRDDCLEDGPIAHVQLAQMLSRMAKEQTKSEAAIHNKALDEWRVRLPPLLSGCIKPSSLILIFRRQSTVLKLAHAHAVMLVNRPFLLSAGADPVLQGFADDCLNAARTVLELVLAFFAEGQPVASFWFTQHIAFNALAVIYIHLLHARPRHHAQLTPSSSTSSPPSLHPHAPEPASSTSLLALADATTQQLATIAEASAPSVRYSIILDELRQDLGVSSSTHKAAAASTQAHPPLHPPPPPVVVDAKPPQKPSGLPNGASTLLLSPPDEAGPSSLSSHDDASPRKPLHLAMVNANGHLGDWDAGCADADVDEELEGEIGSSLFWARLDALPLGWSAASGGGAGVVAAA
ncbi:fungal-specific transcription factor domain-containing protein [Phyllosticta capitalensis]|uniref:fungal-specific transcription factor domain-containing protein n=1 Tax=Phyllosticta capitalensis TaxID=121624 RepID=UPI0031301579